MSNPVLPSASGQLQKDMQGVWWLLTREDHTHDGQIRIDPVLGPDPVAILCYAKEHFAAQFMKRDRSETVAAQVSGTGSNNTNAVGGYDAYFGTYTVDEPSGKVAHTLTGSITPANVGMTVHRDLRVRGNTLFIQLETSTPGGEPITRTLTWKRIS